MSATRKTIPVSEIQSRVNRALDSHLTSPEERLVLASLLEGILQDTGNYHGFRYLPSEYLPVEEQTLDSVLRPNFDHTRRQYL